MFSPRTISFSLVFARPLRKLSRLKLFAFRSTGFVRRMGDRWPELTRENSPANSYRRSMKRKTEPRGRKEIHDRSLCTRSLVLSFPEVESWRFWTTIRARSNQRWIRLDQIRDISSIYGSIYFRSIRLA